ncbi:MAG: dockerin type I domain-containing protein [Monoglobaceae bacterium]
MKLKKLVSALVSGAMVLGTVSIPAFAAVEEPVADEILETAGDVELFSTEDSWIDNADTAWYDNAVEGTTEFTLTTAEQLAGLAKLVNNGNNFSGKTIKLGNDIDLAGKNWTPIGTSSNSFNGIFDGGSYTISNLKITADSGACDVGLFGFTKGGSISNIKVNNAEVKGYLDVGAIAGTPYTSTWKNITLIGDVKVDGYAYVGGLFGKNLYANADNLTINANEGSYVKAYSENYRTYVGGIVGFMGEGGHKVSNVTSNIDVYGSTCDVGGVTGIAHYNNTFENCLCTGNVYITSYQDEGDQLELGGIAGVWHNESGTTVTFKYCTFEGSISATNKNGVKYTGEFQNDGVIGKAYSTSGTGKLIVIKNVAQCGEIKYTSLDEAVAAAGDGETVTVISDIEDMTTVEVAEDKNITIDLNGHTIAAAVRSDNAAKHYYAIDNYGTLVLTDSVGTGKISARGIENLENGKMTVNGIAIESIDNNGGAAIWNEADLVINDCMFTTTYAGKDNGAGCLNNYYGNAKITGGTFNSVNGRVYAIISTGNIEITPDEGKEVNVSGVHGGIASDSGSMVINGGNYSSDDYYGLYVSNDGTGTDPQTAFVTVNGGTFSGKNYSAWIGSDYNNPVNSSIEINGGTFNKPLNAQENTREGAISVKGGTFTTDVKDYVVNGYYQKDNEDGTYTVLPAEAKVIDTAKTTGAEVTLDNLHKNDAINHTDDATYKVVVSTAPAADAEKANEAIKANTSDDNTSKAIFDISVVKTDSNGTTKDVSNTITQQQVTLTLGETPATGTTVYVYHVKSDGTYEQVAAVPADGTNKVTFIAPSFSTYAATYTASSLVEDDITKNVGVAFERIGDTSEYNIVLKALDSKTINRFMSADLTFDMNVTSGAIGYTVNPAASVNLIDKGNGRYEFNLDGLTSSGATGTEVTIGTVTFEGSGSVEFSVKTADTNIVNTAKATDNIVDNYTTAGDGTTTGKLVLNGDVTNGVITETFTAPKKTLTVNIAYNNAINNNAAAYQAMTVTVSGGDLTTPLTYELGKYDPETNISFTVDPETGVPSYTVKIENTLTKNTSYTVTVEGLGYRTACHTVTMTGDKELNFWNNVKDAANATAIEVGKDTTTKNFLAGDIVKDNNINIYDLSAVVSYFGTLNNVNAESAYARYDLNRDGKIDSKDVAYVLVSWGE